MTMGRKETDIQDEMWRSMMLEGREDVPSHIWDSLDARLDTCAPLSTGSHRSHRPVWKRWGITLSSIAAAALIGVTLWLELDDQPTVLSMEPAPALLGQLAKTEPVTTGQDEVTILLPEEDALPLAQAISSSVPVKAANPLTSTVTSTEEEVLEPVEEVPLHETTPVQVQEATEEDSRKTNTEQQESQAADTQEELDHLHLESDWEEKAPVKKARKFSLDLSGNAVGNLSSGKKNSFRHHSIANIMTTSVEERGNIVNDLPLTFGIGVRYNFTKRWAMSVGLNYTLLSRRADAVFNDADGFIKPEKEAYDTRIRNTQHYIGIPVNVYYSILQSDRIDFYATVGGTVEKNVCNQFRLIDLKNKIYRKPVKGVQWSASIGLGVEFGITRWLGIYIDPSLRYYFDCGQPKSIRTSQPLSIGAEIGLRARF